MPRAKLIESWLVATTWERFERELTERLAVNVRHLRDAEGWSQEVAAESAHLSERQWRRIETDDWGERGVTLRTLAKLAIVFDVELDVLFRR